MKRIWKRRILSFLLIFVMLSELANPHIHTEHDVHTAHAWEEEVDCEFCGAFCAVFAAGAGAEPAFAGC